MYHSLRALADRHDALWRSPDEDSLPDRSQAGAIREFTTLVRRSVDGSVLSYSSRLKLLRSAERLGIGRFEGNLIIATIQHHGAGSGSDLPEPSHLGRSILAFLLIQISIVAAAWLLLIR